MSKTVPVAGATGRHGAIAAPTERFRELCPHPEPVLG
jgi:hypothetical protein